jgi:signal transduction histidine kinase
LNERRIGPKNTQGLMTMRTSWWTNLHLRAKGLIVVALPLAALLFASLVLYFLQQQAREEQAVARRILVLRNQIRAVETLLLDAETGIRGFDLAKRPEFLEPYSKAFERLPQALARLEELTGGDAEQLARARRVRFLAGRKLELLGIIRQSSATGQGDSPRAERAVVEDNDLMTQLRGELTAMGVAEQAKLDRQLTEVADDRRRQDIIFGGVVALGLLGGLAATMLFTTGISQRVQRLEENAHRLARGEPLLDRPPGTDELGRLAEALAGASDLLSDREGSLREAKEHAEQANWAKSDFLSRTSHELRTPLSAMLGFAQYLQMRELEPREREVIDRIVIAGNHLASLLTDVLDIARIEAGGLTVSLRPVPVTEAVSSATDLVQPTALEHNVGVEAQVQDHHFVVADAQRLQQILLNLLSNGIKYNRPGGAVTVTSRQAAGDEAVLIDVTDTGAGIPPDKMEGLFVPYDRLGAEESKVEGIGLGLAVTRSLVELMGGSISVTSKPGEGSTFTVGLRSASPAPEDLESEGSGARSA